MTTPKEHRSRHRPPATAPADRVPQPAEDFLSREIASLPPEQAGEAKRVYRVLREAILSGEIPPDIRLDPADLRANFKVGNSVVAPALRTLAREGLTTSYRRGHAVHTVWMGLS